METQLKDYIEIQGVVLTSEAISELLHMQQHENEDLNHHMSQLAAATCFIGSNMYLFDNLEREQAEAREVMVSLCYLRSYLAKLKKPESAKN
jgi:hypothetical protein